MAIKTDCHMHSNYSGDGQASLEEMVKGAIEKGITEICFTEHQDMDYVYHEGDKEGMFEVNTDQYLYDLLKMKEKYSRDIWISFGIELGVQTDIARKLAIYSKSHDFDFIIASSHLCNKKDPYWPEFYEGRDEKEAYHEYFKYEAECIKAFRNFDSYGHLDYVLRYGPNKDANFTMAEYGDDIDVILKLLIDNEKALEVNTGGFNKGLDHPNPREEILKRYKELGGELITIGSDAHRPEDIGFAYDRTEAMLKDLGYKYYAVYKQRLPEMYNL